MRIAVTRARAAWRAMILVGLAGLAACGGDSSAPVVPVSIVLIGSSSLSGVVGQPLASPIKIEIRDAAGAALKNVSFTVIVIGGGTLPNVPAKTTTGSTTLGVWTLGHTAGTQSLQVHSGALSLTINATALPGAAASATVVGSITGTGSTGTPAPFQPSIKVSDAFGNGVSNVAVAVTVSSGGAVQFPTPVTNANGIATTGIWTLGPAAGTDTVTMTASGLAPVTFTVTATVAPGTISIVAGKFQTGAPSSALTVNPVFKLLDNVGNPLSGATVQFAVTFGGGSLGVTSAITDAQGQASPGTWTLGSIAGSQTIVATAGALSQTLYATALASGNSAFNLQVRYFPSPPSAAIQAAFTAAANRISQEVTAHLAGFPVTNFNVGLCFGGTPPPGAPVVTDVITDNAVYVTITPIDGVGQKLGASGPCLFRPSGPNSGLPYLSIMEIDDADANTMLAAGTLPEVILHEMHHTLGYGAAWNDTRFYPLTLISGAGGSNPFYLGAAGNKAYVAAGGVSQNGIPLENQGTPGDGTRDAHWRETTFLTELLTGFHNDGVSNPLSVMSIMELADFGYAVSTTSADPYTLPPGALRAGVQSGASITIQDVVLNPRFKVDATGHVTPVGPVVPPDSTSGVKTATLKNQ